MIQVRNLFYSIGERILLKNLEWMIHPGRHMALIGPNGAGKTTLLRILHGDLKPDEGEIIMRKDMQIGFLPQEEVIIENLPLIDSVMQRQKNIRHIEEQIQLVQMELEAGDTSPELLHKLGHLEHQYAALGGYEAEHLVKRILAGLGFREKDFFRAVSEFSGGWRMRAVLASLLLQEPDVLLLDEPTNHLDLPSLEWLEQYLKKFPGSVIIVSHDRFFIDRLATDIYELERGTLTHYPGNYHFYEEKKAAAVELLKKRYEEQQDALKRQQVFIDRFRYKATKATQVQSRIKMLEKIEIIELPDERRTWSFQIKVAKQSFKNVLTMEQMSFKYDTDWVLEKIDLAIYRGEKIAMVGENGAGKTTLTRLVYGDLTPQEGALIVGENVEIGYYSQHQIDALDLDKTVMEEVSAFASDTLSQRIRNVLGIFQFSGDDVFKKIRVLSGGEKARVSLAKMLLSEANFLIMDEPTNHLDMISKEALEHALQTYDGTLLLISHDRYFLSKLVSKVIELKDHRLKVVEGSYNDYLEKRQAVPTVIQTTEKKEKAQVPGKKSKDQKREEAENRKALAHIKKPLEAKISKLESEIAALESNKISIETELADPKTYGLPDRVKLLHYDHSAIEQKLKACYKDWEIASAELENLLKS